MRSKSLIGVLVVVPGLLFTAISPAPAQSPPPKWLLEPGDVVRGTLESGDAVLDEDDTYYDAYVLPVTAGTRYTISLDSDDFDPYLMITNHATGKTSQDDDGGAGANSRLSLTADVDGFFVIVANSYKEGSGAYSLRIE